MANNRYDWLGAMRKRTRQAYRPDVAGTMIQNLGQGYLGRRIAQDELRKAIMTAMMGTHQPMVGGVPATPEQIRREMQPPGAIEKLIYPSRRTSEPFTWERIKEEPKPLGYKESLLKNFIETGQIPSTFKGKEKEFYKVIGAYVAPEKAKEELPVDWKIWQQAIKEATDPMTKEIDVNLARKRYIELTKVFIPAREPLPAPVERPLEEYTTEELLEEYNKLLGK